jgi:chorismate synthase
VARKFLAAQGVTLDASTVQVGDIAAATFDLAEARRNPLAMPDRAAYLRAADFLRELSERGDSAGGVVECVVRGLGAGLGEPVFDKLDARLGQALFSIGGVKGVEVGDGFRAARATGGANNDAFVLSGGVRKATNHAGGITGGLSDGADLVLRVAFKPTPSIARPQQTVNRAGQPVEITIGGRHDPIIAPRAVVVVEAMAALALADAMLVNAAARLDNFPKDIYPYTQEAIPWNNPLPKR